MKNNYIKCTMERFLPFSNRSYVVQWLAFSIVYQGLILFISARCGTIRHLVCELLFAATGALWPITMIYFSRSFKDAMDASSTLFWDDSEAYAHWYKSAARRVFTVQTTKARALVVTMGAAAICTLFYMGMPAHSSVMNCLVFCLFGFVVFAGAYWAHVLSELMIVLRELVKLTLPVPFFLIPHPRLIRLQNYFLNVSSYSLPRFLPSVFP